MKLGQVGILAAVALFSTLVLYVVGSALLSPRSTTVVAKAPAVAAEPPSQAPPVRPKVNPPATKASTPAPKPAAQPEAAPEEVEEPEAADPVIVNPGKRNAGKGVVVLQIGDSHTAADFMTGELRRRLQARFGKGGLGYITAGRPHVGVRNSTVTVTATKGWSYRSLQRPESRAAEFWLAGYSSVATAVGETITFTADGTVNFEVIEIEAMAQPDGGKIDIKLDGTLEGSYDLKASRVEPVVIRMTPDGAPTERMRELSIVVSGAGTVNIASIAIHDRRAGVTYSSIGYVGATASFVNRFDRKLFANALERLDPQIVVLAFGTNEATNENLDLAAYGRSYERVIDRIKSALPKAIIVVVSPPDFNVLPAECRREKKAANCRAGPALASTSKEDESSEGADKPDCSWRTPAKLAQIREVQQEIAQRHRLVYWNWASIMPQECGAHRWFQSSPPLMAKDHMHFTVNGYKKSAEEFLNVLMPMVEKVRAGAAGTHAVSND